MPELPDGTALCDRCGIELDGYGVIHGMICSDLNEDEEIVYRIYCYINGCRDWILAGV